MKIAIPVLENNGEQSNISEHFGHAPFFAFVELGENKEYSVQIEVNPLSSHGPGDIPRYVSEKGAKILIARGIGGRAIDFFNQFGIEVIRGASGNIEQIMQSLLQNQLKDFNYQVKDKHQDCND